MNLTFIGCTADSINRLDWKGQLRSLILADLKGLISAPSFARLSVDSLRLTQLELAQDFVMPRARQVALDGIKHDIGKPLAWSAPQDLQILSIKATSIDKISSLGLQGHTSLTQLELVGTSTVDFSGLSALSGLATLTLTENPLLNNVPELPAGILKLDLSGTAVHDLSSLGGRNDLTVVAKKMKHSNPMVCPSGVKACIF